MGKRVFKISRPTTRRLISKSLYIKKKNKFIGNLYTGKQHTTKTIKIKGTKTQDEKTQITKIFNEIDGIKTEIIK